MMFSIRLEIGLVATRFVASLWIMEECKSDGDYW